MYNTNLKITKSLTINAGNYESIRPEISIELKDVPVTGIEEAYQNASDMLQKLFELEEASSYIELKKIRDKGLNKHINNIMDQDFDMFGADIKVYITNINKLKELNDNIEIL